MTNRQTKICKIILRHKTLGKILKKSHIKDYLALQEEFCPGSLEFSDFEFEDDTHVSLEKLFLEEFENQQREIFYKRIPLFISICAIVIALFSINTNSLLWMIIGQLFDLIMHT